MLKLPTARHTSATLLHLQRVAAAVIAAWIGYQDVSMGLRLDAHSQDGALQPPRRLPIELAQSWHLASRRSRSASGSCAN